MPIRKPPAPFVDPDTGNLTLAAIQFLNDLQNNPVDGISAINTRISGVAQKADGIIAGTVQLVDVLVSGRGSIIGQVDAINDNVSSVAASVGAGGSLVASVSPSFASASGSGGGPLTTGSVTVTASGGAAPYTYAWTRKSGATLTVTNPTSNVTAFSGTPGIGDVLTATYTCTVTDSAAMSVAVDVFVSLSDLT